VLLLATADRQQPRLVPVGVDLGRTLGERPRLGEHLARDRGARGRDRLVAVRARLDLQRPSRPRIKPLATARIVRSAESPELSTDEATNLRIEPTEARLATRNCSADTQAATVEARHLCSRPRLQDR
jgi:hypothetical protein